MLTIRLSRVGKKKRPTYRIIVLEKRKDPWGDYLELVGNYNPHSKEINLKVDRIKYWISKGAQPSNTVNNLLIKEGVIEGSKKLSVKISKKRKAKKEKTEAANKEKAEKAKTTESPKVNQEPETKPEEVKPETKEGISPEALENKKEEKKEEVKQTT